MMFAQGDKVRRNPVHFPPNHPALMRVGTVVRVGPKHAMVQWDDEPYSEDNTMPYQFGELTKAQ